jgi:hypothetical protein
MNNPMRYLLAPGPSLAGGIFVVSGLAELPACTQAAARIAAAGLPLAPVGGAIAVLPRRSPR